MKMTEHIADDNSSGDPSPDQITNTDIDNYLQDSTKRLKKLRLPDPSILTPSGKDTGRCDSVPQMWFPFPMYPPWSIPPGPHMEGPPRQQSTSNSNDTVTNKDVNKEYDPIEEDVIELLDDDKALEFVEFDLAVNAPSTWT